MSLTPLTIAGVSTFSENLQTILTRAVSIASLPVTALQNKQSDLFVQKQLLSGLRGSTENLAKALQDLRNVSANQALTATSTNASRVSVALSGAATPAVYTITEISSVAKATTETTLAGYASADSTEVAAGGTLQLAFGSETYEITLDAGNNNLNGLRDAINGLGLGLTATIINTGTGSEPYYLTLTAANPGGTTLELRGEAGNPATNILTGNNQGANAVFKLNGIEVVKSDNVISGVVPGLTFTILGKTDPGESVALSLASNRASLGSTIEKLVTAYNTLRDQVNAQVGETAGLLSGDFAVRHIQAKMREIAGFRAPGSTQALASFGIEFASNGAMSFNATKFQSLSSAQVNEAFSFFGGEGGFGSLEAGFRNISDPVSGLIRLQQNQIDTSDAQIGKQIAAMQERITTMRANLAAQLQRADALLASLESQQRFLDANIQSLNLVMYGKKDR